MTLASLNALDRDQFVGALGWIFEDSLWVAERAWERRPFISVDHLYATMVSVVAGADEREQLGLLRAHPDLGTRARMSDASVGEQTGAGLDALSQEEFERLQQLNRAYREKFGFPFLLAVKGSTKHDVLASLAVRVHHRTEREYAEALRQVARIAQFRLRELIRDA